MHILPSVFTALDILVGFDFSLCSSMSHDVFISTVPFWL